MYSALALLLAGMGILWFARHEAQSRSERDVLERTQSTAMLLDDRLRASDFTGPVDDARRVELERLLDPALDGASSASSSGAGTESSPFRMTAR